MVKHKFILTALGALAKDMETLVSEEIKLLQEQERSRFEMKKPEQPVIGVPYNPNKFIPEILYFQRRLEAIRIYLADETIDPKNI